jgi:hypothetical protein
MKILRIIIQQFKDTYCFIGVHDWVYDWEHLKLKFSDRNRTIEADRQYRICKNCYKTQHSGIGMFGNKWFNENEKEMSRRKYIIRRIKLNKLIKQLS